MKETINDLENKLKSLERSSTKNFLTGLSATLYILGLPYVAGFNDGWIGDVTRRYFYSIAVPIFVGAYLIFINSVEKSVDIKEEIKHTNWARIDAIEQLYK